LRHSSMTSIHIILPYQESLGIRQSKHELMVA
jgi:hypothetical protein